VRKPSGSRRPVSFEERTGDEAYAFKAILGSLRFHLGSGTRTGYSSRIKDFALRGDAEISTEDGVRLNLKDGDNVKISSPYGSISRGVTIEKDMRAGIIFIPTAFHENDVMQLIELAQVGNADSPSWKECDVKIERLDDNDQISED
jgi:predicted molibdopterin-dependent oxidoreductase YjgC